MIWLLDLTWAGRVFRFASEPVTVSGAYYVGGLDPSFTLGTEPGTIQGDVEVDLGDLVFPIDVAEWTAQGRPLIGATAVLSTYRDSIKRARVSGTVEATEIGEFGEPVALTLRWTADDGARVVPAEASVGVDTWSAADPGVYGAPYPRVFGRPGLGIGSANNAADNAATGGIKLVIVDPSAVAQHDWKLLVCDGAVDATRVSLLQLYGDGLAVQETGNTLVTETDGLGRTVTTVTPIGMDVETEATLWIDWRSAEKTDGAGGWIPAGATLRRDSNAPILSFGDLLYWLAGETGAACDVAEWATLPALLGGYDVGYYVDDDSSPLDLIEELVKLLPVSVIPGPGGLVPVVWRLDAATADVALVEGGNVSRVSALRVETDGVRTDIELAYAPRADDGEPYAVARADETTHPTCAESYSWLGRRRLRIETPAVYDATTADRIVGWLALSQGSIVERVRYQDWGALDLAVGTVVSVTDSGLHLAGRIGHVVEVSYSGDSTEYVVAMYRLPGRDSLAQ